MGIRYPNWGRWLLLKNLNENEKEEKTCRAHGLRPQRAQQEQQPQQQLIPSLVENNNNYYQNAMDGFRVQIPEGWVMDDIDNTGLAALALGEQLGFELLAVLCPQDQALPAIGGAYRCPIESNLLTTSVYLFRYSNLQDRRDFAPIIAQNKTITISDLFAFHINV